MHRGRLSPLVFAVLALGCTPLSASSQGAWAKVFEPASRTDALVCALAEDGALWSVGGRGAIFVRGREAVERVSVDGVMIEAFGRAPDGSTYAVGTHGTILRRVEAGEWKLEHQSRAPGTKGRVRDENILVGVRAVADGSKWTMVAYGPRGLVLVRDEAGSWRMPEDSTVATRLLAVIKEGPPIALPASCKPATQWRWFDAEHGMTRCHDQRAFASLEGGMVQLGTMPKSCAVLIDVARRGPEVFASCGERGDVWRFADGAWSKVAPLTGIRKLSANAICVVAAADRSVWQHCLQSNSTSRP